MVIAKLLLATAGASRHLLFEKIVRFVVDTEFSPGCHLPYFASLEINPNYFPTL
jgi:hypothetical protein